MMLWKHVLHLMGGMLGANIMTWSALGVLMSAAFSLLVQAISLGFLHFDVRKRLSAKPQWDLRQTATPPASPLYWYKLAQLYVVKVIWYGLVTLLAAHITRTMSA